MLVAISPNFLEIAKILSTSQAGGDHPRSYVDHPGGRTCRPERCTCTCTTCTYSRTHCKRMMNDDPRCSNCCRDSIRRRRRSQTHKGMTAPCIATSTVIRSIIGYGFYSFVHHDFEFCSELNQWRSRCAHTTRLRLIVDYLRAARLLY